ncbi:hypothetical protein AOQ84DRAFT_440304 [Glonium stellatum]|uniref:Myb-like domain-containing protein n=1 Tax=Glonium stellatum TaxID=574774 RepID=A0A8E2JRX1_9PEZI|nr:hypothetical protein AOQ84DRAFT_440304 [Glonium stellatum]
MAIVAKSTKSCFRPTTLRPERSSYTFFSILKAFIKTIMFTYDSYTFYTGFSSRWYSGAGAAEQTTINPYFIHITSVAFMAEGEEELAWYQDAERVPSSPFLDDTTKSTPTIPATPDFTPQRLLEDPPSFDYSAKPRSAILKLIASYNIPETVAWTRRENEALIYEVIWSLCNARAGWETIQQLWERVSGRLARIHDVHKTWSSVRIQYTRHLRGVCGYDERRTLKPHKMRTSLLPTQQGVKRKGRDERGGEGEGEAPTRNRRRRGDGEDDDGPRMVHKIEKRTGKKIAKMCAKPALMMTAIRDDKEQNWSQRATQEVEDRELALMLQAQMNGSRRRR